MSSTTFTCFIFYKYNISFICRSLHICHVFRKEFVVEDYTLCPYDLSLFKRLEESFLFLIR